MSQEECDDLIEERLTKGGLWHEVRDRLRQPGGALAAALPSVARLLGTPREEIGEVMQLTGP